MKKIISIIALTFMMLGVFINDVDAIRLKQNNIVQTNIIYNSTGLDFKIKFNKKNQNHLLANIIILADLKKKGYNINHLYNAINNLYDGKLDGIINKINNSFDRQSIKDSIDKISGIIGGDRTDPNGLLSDFGISFEMGGETHDFGDINDPLSAGKTRGNGLDLGFGKENYGGFGNNGSNAMAGGDTWDVSAHSSSYKNSHNGSATTSVTQESYQNNGDGETRYSFKHADVGSDGSVSGNSFTKHGHSDGTSETSSSTWSKDSNGKTTRTTTYRKYDKDGNLVEKKTKTTKTGMQDPDAPWNEGKTGGSGMPSAGAIKFLKKINPNYSPFINRGSGNAGGTGNNPNEREEGGEGNGTLGLVGDGKVANWGINGKEIHVVGKLAKGKIIRGNLDPVRDTGKGVQSGYQTFNNTGTPPASNTDSITRKYADTKYQGCDHNDLVIGNKVWSSCDIKYPLSDLTNTVGKITNNPNLPDKNYLGYQYGSYFDEESAVCNIGYHVPNKEEFDSLINEFSNSRNTRRDKLAANKIIEYMMFPLAGSRSGETGKYIGVYKYSSYIGSHVNDLGRHGYAGGYSDFVVSNNKGLFSEDIVYVKYPNYEEKGGTHSLRCVRNTLATKNEKSGNQQQLYIKVDEGDYAAGFGKKYSKKPILKGNVKSWNYREKYGSGYVQKNDGDGITRTYANTRYSGCKENDIVIGDKVFAMCNSKKDEGGKSMVNGSKDAKDKHGWEFGRYYFGYYGCESGYRRVLENDLKGINNVRNILKIPYAGYKGNNSDFVGVNSYGLYMLDSVHSLIFSDNKDGYEQNFKRMYSNYKTVRCIRNTPATDEELGQLSDGNDQNGDTNNQNNNLTSTDEYVNEKLGEINECFVSTYNSHLNNLDDTIKRFEDTKNNSNNQKTKDKYEKAIKKLKEIKNIFINRYINILNYKK